MNTYTTRIATIGGSGGAPFDHGEFLTQQGCNLGCGSKGMHLTTLHVERWQVLSHVSAVYTSWSEPSENLTVPGRGKIRDEQKAVDIEIGPDDRVAMVRVEYGGRSYRSGGACLEYLQLGIQAADGTTRVASVGETHSPVGSQTSDATTSDAEISDDGEDSDDDYAACVVGPHQVTTIPRGLTLAGIGGRTGDSWDQVVLHVCPYLPGKGVWRRNLHKHYCKPFKKQVQTLLLCLHRLGKPNATDHQDYTCAVQASVHHLPPDVRESLAAALFHVTFMEDSTAVNGREESAMSQGDYIATWVEEEVAHAMRRIRVSDPFCCSSL